MQTPKKSISPSEWLITNELGSYAWGNFTRTPHRRYDSLLTVRGFGYPSLLVKEVGEVLEVEGRQYTLQQFHFSPTAKATAAAAIATATASTAIVGAPKATQAMVLGPTSAKMRVGKTGALAEWVYNVSSLQICRRLFFLPQRDTVVIEYSFKGIKKPITLGLRPYICSRSHHDLTRANPLFNGEIESVDDKIFLMQPYGAGPSLQMQIWGHDDFNLVAEGKWIQDLFYREDAELGYSAQEDVFQPCEFILHIDSDKKLDLVLGAHTNASPSLGMDVNIVMGRGKATDVDVDMDMDMSRYTDTDLDIDVASAGRGKSTIAEERDLKLFQDQLRLTGAQFLIQVPPLSPPSSPGLLDQQAPSGHRGDLGVATGYPWFSSSARDALLALPGLCISEKNWAGAIEVLRTYGLPLIDVLYKQGFSYTDPKTGVDYSGVDTPLLYVRAVQMLFREAPLTEADRQCFQELVSCMMRALIHSQRDGRVHFSDRGLFINHGPWALTWMKATPQGVPVTPRTGYPIEVNALLYNALAFLSNWDKEFMGLQADMERHFVSQYWNSEKGFFADVAFSREGWEKDLRFRPNQLWLWALEDSPLRGRSPSQQKKWGESVLKQVRTHLLTPLGVRTLSPQDPAYRDEYGGDWWQRDQSYHQGTVWPWLTGLYWDLLVQVEGTAAAKREMIPLAKRMQEHFTQEGCQNQISEMFVGKAPHQSCGAPAHVLGVAEWMRILQAMNAKNSTISM